MSESKSANEVEDNWDEEEATEESGSEESNTEEGASERDAAQGDAEEHYSTDDERSLSAHEFLTEVIDQMEMDCDVQLRRPSEEQSSDIRLEISGPDAGRIIGKRGQVLSALQFLCNRAQNRPGEERRYITVDAEGYRSRRDDSLATMARRLGKKAVTDGKIITFEPMNPRDRRVVHLALAKFEGVITKSEGDGDDRRVQLIPVKR